MSDENKIAAIADKVGLLIHDVRVTKRGNIIRMREDIRVDVRWGKARWKTLALNSRMSRKSIVNAFRQLADALEK